MAKIGEDPNIGKETRFSSENQPKNKGRKPSIKNQLKELALSDGRVTYNPNQVSKVHEDGSVTIIVPKQELIAEKLWSWAMSKRGNDSIKAIQMIMEQFDGKATQPIDANVTGVNGYTIRPAPNE